MDTWNTITRKSRTRLTRALSVLEILCHEENIPILEFLRTKEQTSLAELYLETGESPEKLEKRLASLCDTGCVIHGSVTMGRTYRLDPERIAQVNRISRQLNLIGGGALRE